MNQLYPMTPYNIVAHLEGVAEIQNGSPAYWTYAVCFNFGNQYLRVGYTPKLTRRMESHLSRAPEWPIGVLFNSHSSEASARACERYMINALSPYRRKPDWFLFDDLAHLNSILSTVHRGIEREFCESRWFVLRQSTDHRKHRHGFVIHSRDGVTYLNGSGSFVLERKKRDEEE